MTAGYLSLVPFHTAWVVVLFVFLSDDAAAERSLLVQS